jgi:IS5 family transposase
MEDDLTEVPTIERLGRIERLSNMLPDETTILVVRHLHEKNNLGRTIIDTVKALLKEGQMTMKQGTIIDASLIGVSTYSKYYNGKHEPGDALDQGGNSGIAA